MMQQIELSKLRLDGGTQPRSELNMVVIAEYAEAMQDGVTFPDVTVFYDGTDYWLADGFHRVKAAESAGRDAINADVRQGARRDAVLYSVGANSQHGLRRTNADKRRSVETLLHDDEWRKWSDREIARRCHVSHDFVNRMRRELSLSFNDSEDSEPRTYVTKHGTVATMQTANIGQSTPPPPITTFDDYDTEEAYHRSGQGIELREHPPIRHGADFMQPPPAPFIPKTMPAPEPEPEKPQSTMAVHYSSDTPEWYTPPEIIECVIKVMGAVDLDPCSNDKTAPNVPAGEVYTKDDDGLAQYWHGRVYMNPPYGNEIKEWVDKVVREYEMGQVTQALLLLPSRTDTQWFRALRKYPRCFIHGRLRFSGHDNSAPFPNMIVSLGCDRQTFIDVFSDIGDVYELAVAS